MICSFKRLIHPRSKADAENSGFLVAVYTLHEKVLDGHGDELYEIKAVGPILPLVEGIRFDLKGHWTKNAQHGLQYEVETYEEIITPTKEGIIAYLSSGLIKGIGIKTAERIYAEFGDKTLEILDNRPEELLRVRGISKGKMKKIIAAYTASRAARDIVALLAPHGVSPNRAVKIFKEWGPSATAIIKQNPYRLCELPGIGFRTADEIAKSMGLDPLAPERIDAGLLQTLKDTETKGNLCMPIDLFVRETKNLLDTNEMSLEMVANRALVLDNERKIVRYHGMVYRDKVAKTEQAVASRLHEVLAFGPVRFKCDIDTEIGRIEAQMGIKVAPEQRAAIKTALTSHLSIITGGPGTGKSLILRFLLDIFIAEYGNPKIVCCAPTGRAARRMEECTGHPASTIHKALNLIGGNEDEYEGHNQLRADVVLIDEVSMLDIFINKHLLSALPFGCQVIFIGDADQLPSVGPGAVLSEMIASGIIPVAKLDRVYRQSAGSRIAINASLIRHGTLHLEYGPDFHFLESASFAQSADIIEQLYMAEVQRLGVDNVALLTPYRKKTETGADALNARLRDLVNPSSSAKPEVTYGKKLFRQGDKVMQIRNHEFINNGDIGYITKISKSYDDTLVYVDFGDGRETVYDQQDLEILELAYAQTVHKSQGSEYASVIISLQMAHYVMLKRPLVYTAITRAKTNVNIVGERKALVTAIKRVDAEKRFTMLATRLIELSAAPRAASA